MTEPAKPTMSMKRAELDGMAKAIGIDPSKLRNKQAVIDAVLNRREARDVLRKLTPNARAFLAAFSRSGNITAAAEDAGITRQSHYDWIEADDVRAEYDPADPSSEPGPYRIAFEAATDEAADRLEMEARRRAEEGWREPVYQGGYLVGHKRKYSDRLLLALLEAHHPRFGKRVKHTVEGELTMNVRDARQALQQKVEQALAYRRKHGDGNS